MQIARKLAIYQIQKLFLKNYFHSDNTSKYSTHTSVTHMSQHQLQKLLRIYYLDTECVTQKIQYVIKYMEEIETICFFNKHLLLLENKSTNVIYSFHYGTS